jgi:DNA-binding Xre family transcriptional regulator
MIIKLRVREVAEAQGLNIQELSDKSKIAYSTVLDFWHDRVRRIDKDTLNRLCEALGVGPGVLIVREEGDEKNEAPGLALALA